MASSFTNLLYHVVFSTKERIPLIHDQAREAFRRSSRTLLLGRPLEEGAAAE
jgi:hypothetical protein